MMRSMQDPTCFLVGIGGYKIIWYFVDCVRCCSAAMGRLNNPNILGLANMVWPSG